MNEKFDMPSAKFVKWCFDEKMAGYTVEGIKLFVEVGRISAADYEKITGVPYEA